MWDTLMAGSMTLNPNDHEQAGLILASASPRRLELLSLIGITPDAVIPADIDELPLEGERPRQYVMRMATEKHAVVAKDHPTSFCLAADTVVCLGHRIFGKPEGEAEARTFLKTLSGRRHRVITAIAISTPFDDDQFPQATTRLVDASVKFSRLHETAIDDYIATGEWQGKAGGYAIQGYAARYIQWMGGSYTGIVGLPCFEVAQVLTGLGYRCQRREL
jgi:septum formation protein